MSREIFGIRKLAEAERIISLAPSVDEVEGVTELIRPDSFVMGSRVRLPELLSDRSVSASLLGDASDRTWSRKEWVRISRIETPSILDLLAPASLAAKAFMSQFGAVVIDHPRWPVISDTAENIHDVRMDMEKMRLRTKILLRDLDGKTGKMIDKELEQRTRIGLARHQKTLSDAIAGLESTRLTPRMHSKPREGFGNALMIFQHVDALSVFYHAGPEDIASRFLDAARILGSGASIFLNALTLDQGKTYLIPPATAYGGLGGLDAYRIMGSAQRVELLSSVGPGDAFYYYPEDLPAEIDVDWDVIKLDDLTVRRYFVESESENVGIRTGSSAGALVVTGGEMMLSVAGRRAPLALRPGAAQIMLPHTHAALSAAGGMMPSTAIFIGL